MQDDESEASHRRLAYLPALDGVRAFAVIAVMMFHGGFSFFTGGFMGVDAFFVLSGFLITSLLVGEWRQSLTIKLGAFWARRARRLLPALLLMLLFVAFFASVIVPKGTYGALRLDALSTLLYVSNWHFILVGSNYFNETASASPLIHTWSLAVEEQFYLIWPLMVLGLLRLTRRLGPLFLLCCVAAVASAVWMYVLSAPRRVDQPGVPRNGHPLAMPLHRLRPRRRSGVAHPARPSRGSAGPGRAVAAGRGTGPRAVRSGRPRRGGRGARHVGRHRQHHLVPVLGGVLPRRVWPPPASSSRPWALPQPGAPVLVPDSGPLRGPDLLRALHLALAPFPLGRPRPHRPLGLSLFFVRVLVTFAVAVASFHLVERPIRRGHLPASMAGLGGRALGGGGRAGGHRRGHDRDHGGGEHDYPGSIGTGLPSSTKTPATSATAGPSAGGHQPPVRVLLFGDSVALTLGLGLGTPPDEAKYGYVLVRQRNPRLWGGHGPEPSS